MSAAPELTVAVERAIHDGLKNSIQAIEKEHGIRVLDIRVDWVVAQMLGFRPQFSIGLIRATTESGD